ncbi:hypothetical protein ACH4F3_10200 [Streptomyces anulatus]
MDVTDDVSLDPRNVRLELSDTAPEADIIQDLFQNEKALSLVESICKVGLLTHELPIIVKRAGNNVVVEGNRRVAALKAMQNAYLAPEHRSRIVRITAGVDLKTLRNITVKVAPTQDDADQLIAAIHTGNQRVGWSPARQAAFFQAQIDAGKKPEYLIRHYPTVDVKKFIIRSQILGLFRRATYKDAHLQDYIGKRSFPVSILARLYGNTTFLDLVKITVDESTATVHLRASQREFDKVAEKIIGDIKEKRVNTRTLNANTADSYRNYMDELRDLINAHVDSDVLAVEQRPPSSPAVPPQGSLFQITEARASKTKQDPPITAGPPGSPANVPLNSGSAAQNQSPQVDASTDKLPKPKVTKSIYLNLDEIQVAPGFPASIHLIRQELALINIKNFPNAALDLLRTFLEKSIKAYAESLNEVIRNTANQNGFVQLGHCLTWLEEHLKAHQKTAYIQVISKIRGTALGGYIPTVDHLNAINHNHQIFATPDDVKNCWAGMEGLIKVMLKP